MFVQEWIIIKFDYNQQEHLDGYQVSKSKVNNIAINICALKIKTSGGNLKLECRHVFKMSENRYSGKIETLACCFDLEKLKSYSLLLAKLAEPLYKYSRYKTFREKFGWYNVYYSLSFYTKTGIKRKGLNFLKFEFSYLALEKF